MVNLYEVYDEETGKMIEGYNIKIENRLLNEEEYNHFLKSTNKMSIEDMEKVYNDLDDYWEEQEENKDTQ